MNAIRVAVIAGGSVLAIAVAACSDSAEHITAPSNAGASSGVWRSTVWQPTATGLKYVATREGTYRTDGNGKTVSDTGVVVSIGADAITAAAGKVETGAVLQRLSSVDALRSVSADGGTTLQPKLRNGRTIKLGTRDGKEYSMQVASTAASDAPPGAVLITENGKAVAYRHAQYSKVRGSWRVKHNTSTLLDSTASASLLIDTEYGVSALSASNATSALRSAVSTAADALATLIQPNALHASSFDDASAEACKTELDDVLKATAAWAAAGAALAAATASCPITVFTCAAVPFLTVAFYVADVALGVAIGRHLACVINYWRALPSGTGGGGGGGNSSGSAQCTTIDWYISYDSGRTWNWFGETQTCTTYAE